MFQRSRPVKDQEAYALWALRNRRCAACGIPHHVASRRFGRALTTHHMAKCGRSDEPCNLLRLCWECHSCAEGQPQIRDGVRIPVLTLAHCLWLKRRANPDEFDMVRFAELFHRNPPDLEQPPDEFQREFEAWTGNR